MLRARLSGKSGPALDPCAALQVTIDLEVDAAREITFRLGAGRDADDAAALVLRFRGAAAGVSEAILFRHFITKEDLYNAILDEQELQISADDDSPR